MTGPVRVRELRPGEFDVLDAVFAGLSPTSRYQRFHAGLPQLTPQARERLAAVDGRTHLAVAAFAGATPVGIARLFRAGDTRAELAVEVVDAWQRRGIGTRLLRAVAALGAGAGIRTVEADVLAENVAVQVVFASVFPIMDFTQDGPVVRFTAAVAGATRIEPRAA
ncbi:GNAT family N-acetyltransferase [Pseudonocardia alaniniphila]|uniref:GNAT family N-acetyltransferase n=1 Tax=Pseudonocardia alaniniphila TaxID=75291 RepID=A0ABS9TUQ1_9PSEU|nr:GNAT family N-acetyltransferase [Pseudonocardia alaniniphila]MCH6172290.1 GNAT family N-acetyltransferase [Pseudonocardia alaniniphila]